MFEIPEGKKVNIVDHQRDRDKEAIFSHLHPKEGWILFDQSGILSQIVLEEPSGIRNWDFENGEDFPGEICCVRCPDLVFVLASGKEVTSTECDWSFAEDHEKTVEETYLAYLEEVITKAGKFKK